MTHGYDLRHLFSFPPALGAEADPDDVEDDDDTDDTDDAGDEEQEDTHKDKDPRIKALSHEAKKYRLGKREAERKLAEAQAELDKLKAGTNDVDTLQAENRELRLRLAFNTVAATTGLDPNYLDDVWQHTAFQSDLEIVELKDGKVDTEKLTTVIAAFVDDHPWAKPVGASNGNGDTSDTPPPPLPTTSVGTPRRPSSKSSAEALARRFPALMGRDTAHGKLH